MAWVFNFLGGATENAQTHQGVSMLVIVIFSLFVFP